MLRNRFVTLLTERKVNITKVAEDTGISRGTLQRLKTMDERELYIQLENLMKLCDYFGCKLSELIEYEPDNKKAQSAN